MKRGRRILLMVAGCAIVLVAVLVWPGEREPEYQGKKLSEWLGSYPPNVDTMREYTAAKAAVRQIGTNALPCLLRWVRCTQPRWKYKAYPTFHRLPAAMRIHLIERLISPYNWDQPSSLACRGFEMLGSQASPTLPELTRLANDARRPDVAKNAMAALRAMGRPGFDELKKIGNAKIRLWELLRTNAVSGR